RGTGKTLPPPGSLWLGSGASSRRTRKRGGSGMPRRSGMPRGRSYGRLPLMRRRARSLPQARGEDQHGNDQERRDEPGIDPGIGPEPGTTHAHGNLRPDRKFGTLIELEFPPTLFRLSHVAEGFRIEFQLWIGDEHHDAIRREIEAVREIDPTGERNVIGEAEGVRPGQDRTKAREIATLHLPRLRIRSHTRLEKLYPSR